MQPLPASRHLFLLRFTCSLQYLDPSTISLFFFPNKVVGKIIVLCTLISKFLVRRGEEKSPKYILSSMLLIQSTLNFIVNEILV